MIIQDSQSLATRKCQPCEGGLAKYDLDQAHQRLALVDGWRLTHDGDRIRKDWKMQDFRAGMEFINHVAELAESEGHHPDLHLEGYRRVWIELTTHAIGGLSENDFILAAKIDRLPARVKK